MKLIAILAMAVSVLSTTFLGCGVRMSALDNTFESVSMGLKASGLIDGEGRKVVRGLVVSDEDIMRCRFVMADARIMTAENIGLSMAEKMVKTTEYGMSSVIGFDRVSIYFDSKAIPRRIQISPWIETVVYKYRTPSAILVYDGALLELPVTMDVLNERLPSRTFVTRTYFLK